MTSSLGGRVGPDGGLPGSEQMLRLARDLHKMGPAGRRAIGKRFRDLGGPLLAKARRNAGWSTRIPGAMVVQAVTDSTRGRIGIQLRVRAAEAPHARPYEGINRQGSAGYFRHPVFGDLDTWVSQTVRPFAYPAVVAYGPQARRAIEAAFEDAARECGFR